MSTIVITNAGLPELLNNSLGNFGGSPQADYLQVDLFGNDYTVVPTSVLSDFVIASFPGYGAVRISPAQMGGAEMVSYYATAKYVNNPIVWVNGGPTTFVYGYLVTSLASGNVIWAQNFDVPWELQNRQRLSLNFSFSGFSGP